MNEAKTEANSCAIQCHSTVVRRAELARRCQDQIAARQSAALEAANLADMEAAWGRVEG